jgi:hypothetical protein
MDRWRSDAITRPSAHCEGTLRERESCAEGDTLAEFRRELYELARARRGRDEFSPHGLQFFVEDDGFQDEALVEQHQLNADVAAQLELRGAEHRVHRGELQVPATRDLFVMRTRRIRSS